MAIARSTYITFTKQGATGVQAITGVGFLGKALILWSDRQQSFGEATGVQFCLGLADDDTQATSFIHHPGNETATTSAQNERTNRIVYLTNATSGSTPTLEVEGEFLGFTVDGFRIQWHTNDDVPALFHAIVLGGDIEAELVSPKITVDVGETLAVTGVGFEPTAFIVLGSAADEGGSGDYNLGAPFGSIRGLGFSNATDDVCTWTLGRGTGSASDAERGQHTDRCASLRAANVAGAQDLCSVQITAVSSDGFTISRTSGLNSLNPILHVLAVRGVSFAMGTLATPDATGESSLSVSFKPDLIVLQTHALATATGDGMSMALGAWARLGASGGTWIGGSDNASPSDYASASYSGSVLQSRSIATPSTSVLDVAVARVSADGADLNFTTVPDTSFNLIYMALGPSSGFSSVSEGPFGTDAEYTGDYIGVSWLEFALIQADDTSTMYVWSKVALPDPPEYHFGWKEPRVLRWSRFRRALSDTRGEYQGASFGATLSDTDRVLRGLLGGRLTKYGFYNRPASLFMIADADRRLLKIPYLVAKGFVREAAPLPGLQFSLRMQDYITARFAGLNTQLQIPRRVITATDFANCPEENLGLPVPIIYGEVSDQTLVLTTGDGKGIANVTGLTATVNGDGGTATKRYAVTAMNDVYGNPIGRPHDDHRGETAAVYVTVENAPEDEDISPSNNIELRWDDMGTNAVQYRIYGRYPTLVRLLDAADKDGTGWVYYDGKRPSGTAEFDHLKMDGVPPDTNNTGGSAAATVDTGNGRVEPIYVGITDDLTDVSDDDPEEWHTWVVCGHAVKSILGWYVGGVAQDSSTESASGPWLIPGNTGYNTRVGASPSTVYQDINSRRYTIIYGRRGTIADQAADGSQPLTVNVQGIEDVGDGTGTLITSAIQQFKHFLINWGFQDYQSGAWLSAPTWEDNSDPLIDEDSFDDADDVADERLSGGYVGDGVISEFATLREWIARWSISCDVDNGFSRDLAFFVTMIDERTAALDAAASYGQTLQILRETLRITPDIDAFYNKLPYRYGLRFADDTWAGDTTISDADSITGYRETKTAPSYDLWFISDADVALDQMQRRLIRVKEPPYRVTFDTPLVGFNTELGDILKITHFEGMSTTGWTDHPVRVLAQDVDPDRFMATLECEDVERLFTGAFILGDRTWDVDYTTASSLQKAYGFLADRDTETFSTGDAGKRLR